MTDTQIAALKRLETQIAALEQRHNEVIDLTAETSARLETLSATLSSESQRLSTIW